MLGTGKHVYVYKCVYASMNACHVAAQACNAERGATALQSRVPTAAGRFPRGQGSRCRQREAVPPGELEFWRVPGQGGLRVDDDFILRLPDPAGDHNVLSCWHEPRSSWEAIIIPLDHQCYICTGFRVGCIYIVIV